MSESGKRRRPPAIRIALYVAILLCIGVVALEVGLRAVVFQTTAAHATAIGQAFDNLRVRTYVKQSFERTLDDPSGDRRIPSYEPDDLVGWTYTPGDSSGWRSFDYLGGALSTSYHVNLNIGDDGYRVTSADPERYAGKPEIHFYGGSRTFGQGVSDEDTFAWKVQEALPQFRVRNYAQGGFGNVQGYVQLKDAISRGQPPAIAIFVYAPFHVYRNYGSPSWLGRRVRSDRLKSLVVRLVDGELRTELGMIESRKEADPPVLEMLEVTSRMFDDVFTICKENGILPVLAVECGVGWVPRDRNRTKHVYGASSSDPIVIRAKRQGFDVVHIALTIVSSEIDPYYRVTPNDTHPNARAHAKYAATLIDYLEETLPRLTRPK